MTSKVMKETTKNDDAGGAEKMTSKVTNNDDVETSKKHSHRPCPHDTACHRFHLGDDGELHTDGLACCR